MLLAGDVGGTKILLGLFAAGPQRPIAITVRSYRTLDFDNLTDVVAEFLRSSEKTGTEIESACFGVAGPVTGRQARLTNIPWLVDAEAIGGRFSVRNVSLLNDLEAMAWSIQLLNAGEIAVLQEGVMDERGNAALIAAGTGLGIALLHRVHERLEPLPSEGGHVDFAPRTARELKLAQALIAQFGRAQLEDVVSGPGIANIHRFVHSHACAEIPRAADPDELPSLIAQAALEGRCATCVDTLNTFVSAYGAAAGNLALTALSTGGLYLGGGIAPKILTALRSPVFLDAFCAKAPMADLQKKIPVKVILNAEAALLGSAVYANEQGLRLAGRAGEAGRG